MPPTAWLALVSMERLAVELASKTAFSPAPGTAVFQLPAVSQRVSEAPVQVWSAWAAAAQTVAVTTMAARWRGWNAAMRERNLGFMGLL